MGRYTYYNRTNTCDRCEKDFHGKANREYNKDRNWTGKWLCISCYSSDYRKIVNPGKRFWDDIKYKVTNCRTGNPKSGSSQEKGDKFQRLSCELYIARDLNKDHDYYKSPIDHWCKKLGYFQTKGKLYDPTNRFWTSRWENDRIKKFDVLIYYCASENGDYIERIYIIPKSEIVKRSGITIVKNPKDKWGNTTIPWYEQYRIKDESILRNANKIWEKIINEEGNMIICGPTQVTISYVSQNICNHMVKIYDIRSTYGTIDVLVDNQQIIPGIGSVSVAIAPDFTTRATINLISKNVAAGTATISFGIETIEVPPPVTEATHYLDIYVKPYSWYSVGGAADRIVGKIADINGTILNLFSSVGISDYKYIGTEILTETDKPGLVTIRLHLRQLSAMSLGSSYGYERRYVQSMAVPLIAYIAAIIASVLVIIIIIGVITGWKFTLAGVIEQITGKEYSKEDVHNIIWDKVLPEQMSDCEKNFTNPIDQANCKKSVIAGASDGETDALGLSGTDSATLGIDNKIDACTAQYKIDGDATKYKTCVDAIAKAAGTEIKNKIPKEGDITGAIILGAFILGGIYILTKGAGEVARPILIERERLRAGG